MEEFFITTDHGILWVKDQQETFLVGSQQWDMQNIEFSGNSVALHSMVQEVLPGSVILPYWLPINMIQM